MRKGRELSVSVNDLNLDNQFMSPPTTRGVSSNANIFKDSRIQRLEERNIKLQEEVIRVEKALSGIDEKTTYGIRLPEIKSEVVKKQLENAYKQIKQYQYQVAKRKKLDLEGAYVEQLRKCERTLREKQQLSEKLRKQILNTKKQSLEFTKMLKDDNLKRQYGEKQRKLNTDIKWLHQKIKKVEARKNQINNNMEKEQELIHNIEKELSRLDFSKASMDNLRAKFMTPHMKTMAEQEAEDEEIEPLEERDIDIDNRSPEIFESLMGEVRLYNKLENDYQQKISLLVRQKSQAEQKNMGSRNRLLQVQYEIEKVQARIMELKTQQDPKALIPVKIDLIREETKRYNSLKKINKSKLGMAHLYRFSEVGEATKAGKRFIDRNIIGKKAAKIIAISFYQFKQNKKLCGIKATYLIGKVERQGNKNILSEQNLVQERHFDLQQGDFIKTIDCLQDQHGLIVGISIVSSRNQVLRAGIQTDNRKTITLGPAQIPVCLYGCLLEGGVEMLGTETVEE